MAGVGRKVGVVGFLICVGAACTQLFGDGRQNTLAPISGPQLPATASMFQQPAPAGRAVVCGAGEMRCEGALLQTCADDQTAWVTQQRCAAAALCQPSPAACLAATCGAEEMTCSGSVLQKCNADRTGWDLFDTCLSPAHCNADLRQCMPEPCNPGDRRCDRSEADQSPVLEVCREDRLDWGPLDACVTRELCDQTLTSGLAGGLAVGSDGMLQVQPSAPSGVAQCLLPACAVGEVRCEGARLDFCSEGRTGWNVAEECASPALCEGSLTNVGGAGTPRCLPPACGVGQHQCTEAGVLTVCSEDRTGFQDLEACIGPSFCNAVLADQGQAGCRDAPCEASQMQCNGAQIQVCRDDRTGLDDTGEPCESAALCNADDATNAFCDEPLCRRGPTSGDEFHCEGADLQRCNESLTVYDTIQVCVTPALCDASQGFNGCKTPACEPGQHACSSGFLQTCNADQTGFENTENCGSQSQCDANAGRCADPCQPGSTRCNSTSGDLERCNERLTGWQPIADCQSLALCDAANGRCNICLGGQFSCSDNQLRQCAADGRTFSRQNIGPECAAAPGGGTGVRVCQNNAVVVQACQFGCTNGRCNECQGNGTQCVNGNQIRRCVNGFFANPTSCSDGNPCNGAEGCQNNNCVGGQTLNCNDGNQCTNDSCNNTLGCQFAGFSSAPSCISNGRQVQGCTNGQLQTADCTANLGCTGGRCNNCNQGQCANGTQFQTCDNGQLSTARSCPPNNICQGAGNCVFNCQQLNCNDGNACTNDSCSTQTGCVNTNNTASCSDGNACNGGEVCQGGRCAPGTPVTCNDGNACTTDNNNNCNRTTGTCSFPPTNEGMSCGGNNTCQGGQCRARPAPPAPTCTTGSCNGLQFTACNSGVPAAPVTCTILAGAGAPCLAPTCSARGCGFENINSGPCTFNGRPGTCQAGSCNTLSCTPGAASCSGASDRRVCNAAGNGFTTVACTGNTPRCDILTGQCVECVDASTCSAARDVCSEAACVAGACTIRAKANPPACEDGNFCNGEDQCQAGRCVATGIDRCNFATLPAGDRECTVATACREDGRCVFTAARAGTRCTRANGQVGMCNGFASQTSCVALPPPPPQ